MTEDELTQEVMKELYTNEAFRHFTESTQENDLNVKIMEALKPIIREVTRCPFLGIRSK